MPVLGDRYVAYIAKEETWETAYVINALKAAQLCLSLLFLSIHVLLGEVRPSTLNRLPTARHGIVQFFEALNVR